MAKKPAKLRPDAAEIAFRVMQEATGEAPKTRPPQPILQNAEGATPTPPRKPRAAHHRRLAVVSACGRYSPSPVVMGVEKVTVMGNRRSTRLTNAFSKKAENHVSLMFFFYNYCRPHMTLTKNGGGIKTTPAMAAGISDHVWTVEEMLEMLNPQRVLGKR